MSSRQEQGKVKAETIGKTKMRKKRERREQQILAASEIMERRLKPEHLEQQETQEQMEQEEHQEQQEQLLRGLCPFSLAHSRNPCCISAGGSVVFQQEALFVAA